MYVRVQNKTKKKTNYEMASSFAWRISPTVDVLCCFYVFNIPICELFVCCVVSFDDICFQIVRCIPRICSPFPAGYFFLCGERGGREGSFAVFIAKWCHVAQGLIDSSPTSIQIVAVDSQSSRSLVYRNSKDSVGRDPTMWFDGRPDRPSSGCLLPHIRSSLWLLLPLDER